MKKGLIGSLLFFFLSTGNGYAYKIHYRLEVVNPSRHTTLITLTISDYGKKSMRLEFDDSNFRVSNQQVIEKVEGFASDQAPLKIVKEHDQYLILNNYNSTFSIRYQLTMNQRQNLVFDGPIGYLNQTYLLSKGGWAFLVSRDQKAEQYSVEFDLPEGWREVTPWKGIGKNHVESDYRRFIESTFAAGKFEIREKQIQGTKVRIAADERYKKAFRETLFEDGFKIFAYLKSVFNTQHPASHLSIFVKPVGEKERQYINESGESHGEATARLDEALFQFEHRVFHTFNAFPPAGMRVQSGWFLEGVNEYYYLLSLLHLRAEKPFEKLRHLYFNDYLPKKERWDSPLGQSKPETGDKAYFLNYQKGALVAYLLDRKIRQTTNGTKTLSHVLGDLYKEYGQYRTGVITEKI
ncbi:hypothetical protein KKA14_22270, partial [bacterium]|nr:hypothetical protein [bacterium]